MKIILLSSLLFLSSLSLFSQTFTEASLNYIVTDAMSNPPTVEVTGASSSFTDLNIPDTVTNSGITYNVTSIGESAFIFNNLVTVNLSNNLDTIKPFAFFDNELSSVIIPNTVTNIDNFAFSQNNLTSITLPSNINNIGNSAFTSNSLTNIIAEGTTPASILSLPTRTFANNRGDIMLTVPVGSEQDYIDAGWTGFLDFTVDGLNYSITNYTIIPLTVEIIGQSGSLTDITIPASVTNNSINYSVTSIGNAAFQGNNLTSVIIPNSIISIGRGAFFNNNLTSVTIPNSVTSIDDFAFSQNNLINVTSQATIPPSIQEMSFGDRSNITLTVPEGTAQDYIDAGWTDFANDAILSVSDFEIANDIVISIDTSRIKINSSSTVNFKNYIIYSISGAIINSGLENEINLESLASGMYILHAFFDKGSLVKKFVVN